jgi:NTP pyrophosphatase (non-canonical NTP hydrolase)
MGIDQFPFCIDRTDNRTKVVLPALAGKPTADIRQSRLFATADLLQDLVMTPSRDIGRLLEIMAALRTPGTGCPWDLAQNFSTIAPYTLEEAYEVADAITRDDMADLKEELGDLLLQVVYHARMAEERGAFSFGDVVQAITER